MRLTPYCALRLYPRAERKGGDRFLGVDDLSRRSMTGAADVIFCAGLGDETRGDPATAPQHRSRGP